MQEAPRIVAGVDLGSNSFHLLVARHEEDGRVHVLDRLRDPVRIAAGLDGDHRLTDETVERAVASLERFGERLRDMPARSVRAVGTNTLRQARNAPQVEEALSRALGHPVEIISGREEARLIYLGVAHTTPAGEGRQLVLDIGGGSTECILGEGLEPIVLDSLYMGCVSFTRRFFASGRLSGEAFREAELAAGLELSSLVELYRRIGWSRAVGSSGTILAVSELLRRLELSDGTVTGAALEKLERAMVDCGELGELELPGLEPERAAVLPGGVAILHAAIRFLGIESLGPSSGALREGLVHSLLGSSGAGDPRERSVEGCALRHKVDAEHAARVETTALELFDSANRSWETPAEPARQLLSWAARLHEIGLSISYAGHHKHGAYILEHAEMPGFSIDDRLLLAAVVGSHRRRPERSATEGLTRERRKLALRLTTVLRLAVRLQRGRSRDPLPPLDLRVKKSRLRLVLPAGWIESRPLTRADLDEEVECLARIGLELEYGSDGPASSHEAAPEDDAPAG